jgi:adenylate cyclase
VFGRDPSFDPRHSSIVRTEARKLRARLAKYYRIEGSVRRSGDRVRILVQIDDTGSERTAWSQTYSRKIGGAFRVQEGDSA